MLCGMPEIDLRPEDYRAVEPPKPSWWARLNAKPADWDKPERRWARLASAVIMGLALYWVKTRH